jgi:type I restriction enzyme, S subunit
MELKPGYKRTDVGVIPSDWNIHTLHDDIERLNAGVSVNSLDNDQVLSDEPSILKTSAVSNGQFLPHERKVIAPRDLSRAKLNPRADSIIISRMNTPELVGECGYVEKDFPYLYLPDRLWMTSFKRNSGVNAKWLSYLLAYSEYRLKLRNAATGTSGSMKNISKDALLSIVIPFPPLEEQYTIAAALSDVDSLIAALDRLIAKKRDIKQATMQELLTGKRRLPSFNGEWGVKCLGDTTYCLDNLRIPLNEVQRNQMKGDYPYCGANGVLDFVNNFVIDDDIILMAEDGGYFDEYAVRPIAYRMIGKCWINNHVHILKARAEYDQGFIFYSLVHKNILSYLTNGTRAKLNKSEMVKIEVLLPLEKDDQIAIATVLSDMDAEIAALEARNERTRALKQGMMQELLTGRIRLVQGAEA